MKVVELNIQGIKCDNESCDYIDMGVKYEDYKEYLNKPCPKCGENLLTEEDYNATKQIVAITKFMNKILPKRKDDEDVVTGEIDMNGSGMIDFKIRE